MFQFFGNIRFLSVLPSMESTNRNQSDAVVSEVIERFCYLLCVCNFLTKNAIVSPFQLLHVRSVRSKLYHICGLFIYSFEFDIIILSESVLRSFGVALPKTILFCTYYRSAIVKMKLLLVHCNCSKELLWIQISNHNLLCIYLTSIPRKKVHMNILYYIMLICHQNR